jgi:adenylate cyclase
MGADEDGTMRGLTATRAIIEALVAEHRGRIANTAGDAVLAEFPSVVAGLFCGIAVQRAIARISRPTAASSSASGCMSAM